MALGSSRLGLIAALVAGGLLLWLAVPRFAAGLLVAPHGQIFERLQDGEPVPMADLDRAVRAHERALGWHDNAHDRMRLGQLQFAMAALLTDAPDARRARLRESIEAHQAALSRDPALPYAWTQLAIALAVIEGPTPRFAAALAEAIRSAPYAPRLVMARIELGLWAWEGLSAETRSLVSDQIDVAVRLLRGRYRQGFSSADLRARLRRSLVDRPRLLCRSEAVLAGVDPAARC